MNLRLFPASQPKSGNEPLSHACVTDESTASKPRHPQRTEGAIIAPLSPKRPDPALTPARPRYVAPTCKHTTKRLAVARRNVRRCRKSSRLKKKPRALGVGCSGLRSGIGGEKVRTLLLEQSTCQRRQRRPLWGIKVSSHLEVAS